MDLSVYLIGNLVFIALLYWIVRNKDKHITKRLITPTPALRNRLGGIVETVNYPINETVSC